MFMTDFKNKTKVIAIINWNEQNNITVNDLRIIECDIYRGKKLRSGKRYQRSINVEVKDLI